MAEIIVFSPGFVSHKFVRHAQIITKSIEDAIKAHKGKEVSLPITLEGGLKETMYELPAGGAVQVGIITELPKNEGFVTRVDGKKYSGGGYVLFYGFKEPSDYERLKKIIDELAQEVKENFT